MTKSEYDRIEARLTARRDYLKNEIDLLARYHPNRPWLKGAEHGLDDAINILREMRKMKYIDVQ